MRCVQTELCGEIQMKRGMLMLLLLSGCQQSNGVGREEYERLQDRVARLESSAHDLASKPIEAPTPASQPISPARQPEKTAINTYQLIGTSFHGEGSHFYPSKAKCEAAKAALVQGWKEEQEAMDPRPVFINRPSPNCIPI